MAFGIHIDPLYLRHLPPEGHPERPERIERLLSGVDELVEAGARRFESHRAATHDELSRAHSPGHVDAIAATAGRPHVMIDPDTHTSAESYDIACRAAGAFLDVVDAVMEGNLDAGFAAVRPPGHHAERDRAMGFCLFNNVAVAAAHLVVHHGLERVLVVDWDVHHGNGTQHIFEEDPRVMFVSLHQYPFYPGTGAAGETGVGEGRGRTVNIPLPAGCEDSDYFAAFDRIVLPSADAFAPQFVLISAGFDAHTADPLGGMHVTAAGFEGMTSMLAGLAARHCKGRVASVLEGGYSLHGLAACVEKMVLRSVAGPEDPGERREPVVGAAALARALEVQQKEGALARHD